MNLQDVFREMHEYREKLYAPMRNAVKRFTQNHNWELDRANLTDSEIMESPHVWDDWPLEEQISWLGNFKDHTPDT